MPARARLLLCTCPGDAAERIAAGLLERRLVACVNALDGVASRYWWKGSLSCDRETLLLMKTESDRVGEVVAALKQLHPYEVPELLSVAIDDGAPAYLEWLRDSLADPPATPPERAGAS